jgi:dolichol-phosphate mannosyltransferase
MKLSVISPTLNEAGNVSRLVEELERALIGIDYEILIVDDNSPDLTWSVAQEISLTHPRVRILRRMRDPGLSVAVIDGFSAAKGDVVACIDADLQHDPSILARMLDELQQGADVVVGSRHIDGGSTGEWNRLRRIESWIATKTAHLLLGFRLKDPMSGYFLLWRKDFSKVRGQLNGKGFKILLEILARLHASKIKEVPYTFRPRTKGQSKLTGKVILQYLLQLWRLCSSSRHLFVRFMKSVVVGSIGVFVNLAVMALLLKLTKIQSWRASAIASLAANMQNYVLHNIWTYADRPRKAFRMLGDYFSYLLMSAPGLVITTVSYAGLAWSLAHTPVMRDGAGASFFYARLSCQFAGVLLGVWTNGALNKVFTRPEAVRLDLGSPEESPNSTLNGQPEKQPGKSVTNFAPEVGE